MSALCALPGNLLVSGSSDEQLRFWDLGKMQCLGTLSLLSAVRTSFIGELRPTGFFWRLSLPIASNNP